MEEVVFDVEDEVALFQLPVLLLQLPLLLLCAKSEFRFGVFDCLKVDLGLEYLIV